MSTRPIPPSHEVHRAGLRLATRVLLVVLAWTASATRSDAAAYYTATYIASNDAFRWDSATVTSFQTGTAVTYPFVTTTTPLTTADLQNLPGGTATINSGGLGPQTVPYTMDAYGINSSGTVYGAIPVGPSGGESNMGESATMGYAVRSPDGQYTPFIPLAAPFNAGFYGSIYLSQSNQILLSVVNSMSSALVDVKTGTTTPISQLFPPALLQQLIGSSAGGSPWILPEGIDDRGDILVMVGGLTGANLDEIYILTPAGLAAPAPIPEPSSLLIFGLVAGAMGLRTVVRRSRGCAGE